MNQLTQDFLTKKHVANLENLTEAVKQLRVEEIGKIVETVKVALGTNTKAIDDLKSTINIDAICRAVATYTPTLSEQVSIAKSIKKALYQITFILILISCELLWICLKR